MASDNLAVFFLAVEIAQKIKPMIFWNLKGNFVSFIVKPLRKKWKKIELSFHLV